MRRRTHVRPARLFALVRRHPLFIAVGALLLAAGYLHEVWIARPSMSWMGLPEGRTGAATWTRVLRNEGFLVGWSDLRGNPLWVVYRLTPIADNAPRPPRPERFSADWRALGLVDHGDYSGSGFDRGHLAPNYAISRLYGRGAQLDTFLLTNVSPQRPHLNQRLWQRLEEIEVDVFAPRLGAVWVMTGPVFDSEVERLPGNGLVEIPDAFYKVLAVPREGAEPLLLAFIMPQHVRGNEPLDRFVVSVDEVEARTGLDFFAELDDSVETRVEAAVDPAAFDLQTVAQMPSRFDRPRRNKNRR